MHFMVILKIVNLDNNRGSIKVFPLNIKWKSRLRADK